VKEKAVSYQLLAFSSETKKQAKTFGAFLRGLLLLAGLSVLAQGAGPPYPWLKPGEVVESLDSRIAPPAGFERVQAPPGSFAAWLRRLPLKPGCPPVLLYNGQPKARQDVHAAVVAMDVGREDLQQCADAVIRLRAEYLRSKGDAAAIRFHFTSGDLAEYVRWSAGYRPIVAGNRITWARRSEPDDSYESFRRYLDTVFKYAGSDSLSRELIPVRSVAEIEAGDVFIHGGFPGHAVIVADVARLRVPGKKVFLLAQSYMPAQEVHVLKNLADMSLSPWYSADFGETLVTPEWSFGRDELRRFQ